MDEKLNQMQLQESQDVNQEVPFYHGNHINAMIQSNKQAWDKATVEYLEYCKTYYVNFILANRF